MGGSYGPSAVPPSTLPPHRLALGRRVRALREERGWSQEDLAEVAGLHRNYVGGIERGERNLGIDNLMAIARTLDVDPGELVAGLA